MTGLDIFVAVVTGFSFLTAFSLILYTCHREAIERAKPVVTGRPYSQRTKKFIVTQCGKIIDLRYTRPRVMTQTEAVAYCHNLDHYGWLGSHDEYAIELMSVLKSIPDLHDQPRTITRDQWLKLWAYDGRDTRIAGPFEDGSVMVVREREPPVRIDKEGWAEEVVLVPMSDMK